MLRRRSLLIGALIGLAALGIGCMWDYDTIAMESKEFPDLADVVTGRFGRNPPLYYQMRLARVTAELRVEPTKLDAYDDAGVACDRLGDDDSALHWMALKREAMKRLPRAASAENRTTGSEDPVYRLLANEGTFYAHKWFRGGRRPEALGLLDQSVADLNAAVKRNPDAHFGREKVQVFVIEWSRKMSMAPPPAVEVITLSPEKPSPNRSAGELFAEPDSLYSYLQSKGLSDEAICKGISGLVVLGNAWESPDSFITLAEAVPMRRGTMKMFVALRAQELIASGHKPLGPALDPDLGKWTTPAALQPSIRASFQRLRHAADDEDRRRTEYMMSRLLAGRHPDIDPSFWSEWKPSKRPDFVDPDLNYRFFRWLERGGLPQILTVLGCCCLSPLGLLALTWRSLAKRARRRIAALGDLKFVNQTESRANDVKK
ncbi:MAG TPA: hypothetical protein VKT78_15770 [Fimbriimonadaceae bacterium]|nr:hypothetical protein [Fimbriimonadaceae bacterium]